MIRAAILATLALSAPVAAQEAPTELWGGIRVGMTLDEAVAAQPKYTVKLTDDCKANREIMFEGDDQKKPVVGVRLYAGLAPSAEHCVALVRDGLRAKYGEPIDTATTQPDSGPILRRGSRATQQRYTFNNGTVRVIFTSTTGDNIGPDKWEAIYEPMTAVKGIASKL